MTYARFRSSIWLTTVLPAVLLALGVGGLYAMIRGRPLSEVDRAPDLAPLANTAMVLAHDGGINLSVDGVVTPYREIELSAEVAGRILRKAPEARSGHFVTRGTLLYEIDPRDYELELQRLDEQLQQAEATRAETAVELDNTQKLIDLSLEEHELQKRELNRVTRLAGAVSESEVDKVKRSEWMSRNTMLTLQNQLLLIGSRRRGLENARNLVQTQIEKSRLDLARTRIVAPVDGVIVRDPVEQDSFVQKGAVLAVVEDTTKVEVLCNLKMEELVWIWRQGHPESQPAVPSESPSELPLAGGDDPDQSLSVRHIDGRAHYELPQTPVTVIFRMQGDQTRFQWRGSLTRFEGSGIDEKTRTVPCRVVVDDPREVTVAGDDARVGPPALVRGMYVTVAIHATPNTQFVRLPEAAVQPGKTVLRVRDGRLDIVGPVELIQLSQGSVAACRANGFGSRIRWTPG